MSQVFASKSLDFITALHSPYERQSPNGRSGCGRETNEKGQCPHLQKETLLYKRRRMPERPDQWVPFLLSCDRAYSRSPEQIENWAWKKVKRGMGIEKHPKGDGKR